MAKFYAVKKGFKTGIFTSWEECQLAIKNYKGAIYKSFKDENEAIAYLNVALNDSITNDQIDDLINKLESDEGIAFIDGSYDVKTNSYASAYILFSKTKNYQDSFIGDPKYANYRNVAGEIFALIRVVSLAIKLKLKQITIFYDYLGIEAWANQLWEAKSELSIAYKSFITKALKMIKINFYHTKSHSGIKYNEMVDELAKNILKKKD